MTPHPIIVQPETRVTRAVVEMSRHKVRQLPVALPHDWGLELCGIVTCHDLLRSLPPEAAEAEDVPSEEIIVDAVADVMSREVLTVSPDDPLDRAASLLLERRVGALPVVQGPRLVGILSRGDLLGALVYLLRAQPFLPKISAKKSFIAAQERRSARGS